MKTDTVYKRTFNRLLELMARLGPNAELPSENDLGRGAAVSRTTIRKVLRELESRGLIVLSGSAKTVLKPPAPEDYFPDAQTVSNFAQVEKLFMEWMLRGDTKPGTQINELDLARQFGVGTTGIREFLNRFSRFGLIEKRPNSGWLFKGFTEDFALELFEIRQLFELRSALAFSQQGLESPLWARMKIIERQHHALLAEIDTRFHDFSDLDDRFHRLINEAAPNRFINDFYDIITFIFHYHYQWNKRDEKIRNRVAILEHINYIEALQSRDPERVKAACRLHLSSAQKTLLDTFRIEASTDTPAPQLTATPVNA